VLPDLSLQSETGGVSTDTEIDFVLRRLSAGEGYVYCIYLKNNVKAGTEK
jgi:hypothetical protein